MRSDDALVFSLLETAVSPSTCLDGDLSSSSCCRTTKASPILAAGRKVTLPETNIYLKMDGWKTSFLLRFGIVFFQVQTVSGMVIFSSTETFSRDGSYTWNFRLCEIIAWSWNNTFFCCLGYFLLFSKNNVVSCLGFWLLGNGWQPVLFLRFLGGKLRFLDGKLRRFKCLSAPWWDVQCPKTSQNQKTLGGKQKMQVPQKSNNFWKSKNLASFGRSRYVLITFAFS